MALSAVRADDVEELGVGIESRAFGVELLIGHGRDQCDQPLLPDLVSLQSGDGGRDTLVDRDHAAVDVAELHARDPAEILVVAHILHLPLSRDGHERRLFGEGNGRGQRPRCNCDAQKPADREIHVTPPSRVGLPQCDPSGCPYSGAERLSASLPALKTVAPYTCIVYNYT